MNRVLKPGMNLAAFKEDLEALVAKHGGTLKSGPTFNVSMPKKVIEGRHGLIMEERTPINIEVSINAESVIAFRGEEGGAA